MAMEEIDASYGLLLVGWAPRTSTEEYFGEANKILLRRQFAWLGRRSFAMQFCQNELENSVLVSGSFPDLKLHRSEISDSLCIWLKEKSGLFTQDSERNGVVARLLSLSALFPTWSKVSKSPQDCVTLSPGWLVRGRRVGTVPPEYEWCYDSFLMKSKSSFYGAAANVASAPVFGIAFLLHFPANWWRQFRAYVGRLPKHSSKLSSVEWLAVFFIASLATLVQSHVIVKLSFLGLFLYFFAYQVMQRRLAIRLQPKLFWFYSWYIAVAIIWAIVGLLYPGNYNQGVLEAVQLYVVWSLAFYQFPGRC